jgi:predicted nucleotidyltransferase
VDLAPDFKELLEEFVREKVEFVIVGGYAVAFHGRPRATKDLDILLAGAGENLERAARAAARFGAPDNVVAALQVMTPSEVVFMGQPPLRIDLLRAIDGVDTDALYARAVEAEIAGIAVRVIALDDLIVNKRAAGRPQDLVDADLLERVRARRGES